MASLKKTDLKQIIDMFEVELSLLPKLAKIEKMKMRSRIRRELYCLVALNNQTAHRLIKRLEEKLPDVFSVYPYGFSDKLEDLIELKLAKAQQEERRQRLSARAAKPPGGFSPYSTQK